MASPSLSSKSGSKRESLGKSVFLRVVAVGLLVLLVGRTYVASGGNFSMAGAPTFTEQKIEKVVKYQLDPVKWTDWVSIAQLKPPEVPDNARFQFQVNAPSWHEYRFWDGTTEIVQDSSKRWLGGITQSTFKLRGEGEAIFRITYIFSR